MYSAKCVVRFATLSDGKVFEPLNSFKAHQRRLAYHQRRMARRFTFGKNWHKARRKVQRRQLEYKLGWKGGMLIAVPPHHSSQRCPVCGYTAARNRLTQAQFRCCQCGYCGNADRIAAINILARGHRVTACGDTSSAQGTPAQEPTEANLYEMIHAAL